MFTNFEESEESVDNFAGNTKNVPIVQMGTSQLSK